MKMKIDPYIPPSNGVCKRGCCWTPYGCGKNLRCVCHPVSHAKWLKDIEKAVQQKEQEND